GHQQALFLVLAAVATGHGAEICADDQAGPGGGGHGQPPRPAAPPATGRGRVARYAGGHPKRADQSTECVISLAASRSEKPFSLRSHSANAKPQAVKGLRSPWATSPIAMPASIWSFTTRLCKAWRRF